MSSHKEKIEKLERDYEVLKKEIAEINQREKIKEEISRYIKTQQQPIFKYMLKVLQYLVVIIMVLITGNKGVDKVMESHPWIMRIME